MIATLVCSALRWYPFAKGVNTFADSRLGHAVANRGTTEITTLWSGPKVLVRPNDCMGRRIFLTGAVDRRLERFCCSFIRSGDTVLDIGANFGSVSLSLAARGARVHAFEPQPELAQLLRKSVALNNYSDITVHEVALSNRSGKTHFSISASNSGLGHIGETGEILVDMVNAGDYLSGLHLSRVRLVKIDVEGHEVEVFTSAREWFKALRPEYVVFEAHYNAGITAGLRELGYDIARIHGYDWVAKLPDAD